MASTTRPTQIPAASAPQLLSVPEVARRLSISRQSVYDLIGSGQLSRVDVGSAKQPRVRIKESVLADFIERRTHEAPKRSGRAA